MILFQIFLLMLFASYITGAIVVAGIFLYPLKKNGITKSDFLLLVFLSWYSVGVFFCAIAEELDERL